jgi:hypothetical protein
MIRGNIRYDHHQKSVQIILKTPISGSNYLKIIIVNQCWLVLKIYRCRVSYPGMLLPMHAELIVDYSITTSPIRYNQRQILNGITVRHRMDDSWRGISRLRTSSRTCIYFSQGLGLLASSSRLIDRAQLHNDGRSVCFSSCFVRQDACYAGGGTWWEVCYVISINDGKVVNKESTYYPRANENNTTVGLTR